MDNTYIEVPIEAARLIANKYNKEQVVIICWDEDHGKTHVTTYGTTKKHCEWATKLGNIIKRDVLKWPEEECNSQPDKLFEPEKWK